MSHRFILLAALALSGLSGACDGGVDGLELAPTDDGPFVGGRVAWADGVLLVELHGRDGLTDAEGGQPEIEAFDAAGRSLMRERIFLWDAWVDDDRPWVTFYLLDVRPAEVVARATEGTITLRTVREIPVAAAGGGCDPVGVDNRCPVGSTCQPPDDIQHIRQTGNARPVPAVRATIGRCVDVELQGYRHPAEDGEGTDAVIDIRPAARLPYPRAIASLGDSNGLLLTRFGELRDDTRGLMRVRLPGDDLDSPIAIHFGPHLTGRVARLEEPAARRAGDVCDPEGVTTHCMADTMCVDAVCTPATPPTFSHIEARASGDAIIVEFDAVDADGDIVDFDVVAVSADTDRPVVSHWAEPRRQWWDERPVLHAELDRHPDGVRGRLSAVPFRRDDDRPFDTVRVVVRDARGLSTTIEVPTQVTAPEVRAVDALCDPFGVDSTCEPGAICEAADGEGVARCQIVHPDRAACLDAPVFVDAVEDEWQGDEATSHFSCINGVNGFADDIIPVRSYTFIAPEAGTFEFEMGGSRIGLAIRSACDLPSSERRADWGGLACASARYPIVRVTLRAGERVYVVAGDWVDFGWPRFAEDSAFRLTATRLPDE